MSNEIKATEEKGLVNPMEWGKIFADSGMFPDIKSASQGAVKILAGRELGFSAIQSVLSFYFVNGRLGLLAQAMAALIKKSGKYDYVIKEHTNENCLIEFFKINGERERMGEASFNKTMAASAGVINKDNYKNFPMNMYFARALANGAKWFCPDAIFGFYTVEELQDLTIETKPSVVTIDAEGEVKNGESA